MPGRKFNTQNYAFGFNGQIQDAEWMGGQSVAFEARIHDGRLGRWLSVDPLEGAYPYASPYSYALNSPVQAVDVDGEYVEPVTKAFAEKLVRETNNLLIAKYGKENAPQVELNVIPKGSFFIFTQESYRIMPKKGTPWYERSKEGKSGKYIKALFEQLVASETTIRVVELDGNTPTKGGMTLEMSKGFTRTAHMIELWDGLPTISDFKVIADDDDAFYELPKFDIKKEEAYTDWEGEFHPAETITHVAKPTVHSQWTLGGTFWHELINHTNYTIGTMEKEGAWRMQDEFVLPRSSYQHQSTEAKRFTWLQQLVLDSRIKEYTKAGGNKTSGSRSSRGGGSSNGGGGSSRGRSDGNRGGDGNSGGCGEVW